MGLAARRARVVVQCMHTWVMGWKKTAAQCPAGGPGTDTGTGAGTRHSRSRNPQLLTVREGCDWMFKRRGKEHRGELGWISLSMARLCTSYNDNVHVCTK